MGSGVRDLRAGQPFPLNGLPVWLSAISRVNPLTYLARCGIHRQEHASTARARFPTGAELFGTKLPIGAELGITAAFALTSLVVAVRGFNPTV